MRRFCLTTLLLALVGSTTVWAQSPAKKPSDLAANAALQYWQAFSQMPADKENEKMLADWQKAPLDDAGVQRLIASSHQSLLYLQRGSALKACDWGLDYHDGISLLLPHLAKSRDLARLAALRARSNFEQAHHGRARDDAMGMMMLARHVGRDPIMICLLVRVAIEGMVVDLVAPYVPDLKASYTQSVAAFQSLPVAITLQQTIPVERDFMVKWIIPKLKEEEARQPGAWRDLWRGLIHGEGQDLPEAVKRVESIGEAIKMVEDIIPIYDDLSRLLTLPQDQFDAQYPSFKQQTKANYPLAGILLPAIDQLRAKEQRSEARLGMLLAAIAVVESGPEKLKEIKSPSGPYEYRALDKGFELKSKLLYEGQPVTLTVGQRR